MTCITCGASLDATSTSCPACGEPVAGATQDPASGPASGDAGRYGAEYSGAYAGAYGSHGSHGYQQSPPPSGAGQWATPQPHPSGLSSEVRGWAIAAHLGGLLAAMMTAATLGFLGPLVVWLLKREDHPFVDHHAKEALNFQLTVLLALLSSVVLAIPAVIVGVLTLGIGLIALALVVVAATIAWVALPIVGAVKAANGEGFRYPVTIRFVR